MSKSQQKLDGISIIRTVATIAIMLYHIGFGHYYLKQVNFSFSVHVFFCISAFLIMYTTEHKTAASFLKRRLIRILPLYLLLTVFTFFASKFLSGFGQDNIGVPELIKSLLFIPYSRSGLKSELAVRPIVGPGWTLYYDVWFAFAFAISMKIKHKYRGIIAGCICVALYLFGILLPEEVPVAVLLSNGFVLSFAAGIVVYYVWRGFLQQKTTSVPLIWGMAAVLLLGCLYLLPRNILLQILVSSFILICTLISTAQKPIPKGFTQFSNLSYSFYLLHYYVILIIGKMIDFTQFNGKVILGTVIVFCVTLLISFCSYILIEKKLGNLLNRFCKASR